MYGLCLLGMAQAALGIPVDSNILSLANRDLRGYSAAAEADRVENLPGVDKLDFGLFSGYVN